MNFAVSEEQQQLRLSVQRMLAETNDFESRRRRLRSADPDRMALWPQFAELGVIAAAFDEAHEGFAGDPRTVAVVQSALGESLTVEPYLANAVIVGRILQRSSSTLAARLIGESIAGNTPCVLAHDPGTDPFAAPTVTLTGGRAGAVLNGTLRCVRHADVAGGFLVPAIADGVVSIHHVPGNTPGMSLHTFRLIDGAGAGELALRSVSVPPEARLEFDGNAADVLHDALEWGLLGLAAEAAGIVEALNRATFAYLGNRKQFGVPLATFQALQHRAADMFIAAEEIAAAVNYAIEAMAGAPGEARSAAICAAKVVADSGGRRIGHEAIQLHGGMGVSDELNVSHYARRLTAIRAELGSADALRLRFAGLDMVRVGESPEKRAWRGEVRRFVETHLPADLARKVATGLKIEKDDYVRWQKILYAQGWFAGSWPREYGGQGWDLVKQLIFTQEAATCNAPMIMPYGVGMVGPVIYTYGNDDQKRAHLPGILSSDVWWCQGYSEPGAGSDLASLKTFAELDGDHYVVNGSKMWTTEAHWADKMHCLVRTSRDGKPQQGISFLLIDMRTPGITVQPIVTIDGIHHTNQTFFDNVRVPVTNRVGDEGRGWAIAKFLLGNERTSIADTGPKLRLLRQLKSMHGAFVADARNGAALQAAVTLALADLEIQLLTLCNLEAHYVDVWMTGRKVGAEASILKIRGTEILQALSELALQLEGPMAAAHDPADLHLSADAGLTPAQHASMMGHEYLYGRCWSIFGGTNEIQRNIIAREILST